MLKDWVKSESIPLKNDIEMIKSYMRNLVIEKMLTRVYYLMNFLYRYK